MASERPRCRLVGEDGNVFNLIAKVSRCLRDNGMRKEASEMQDRVFACGSYEEALGIMGEYVEIY